MIGYTTIGTRDLERARQFYDAALVPLGGRRALNYQRSAYYGNPSRGAMLGITLPFDGEAAGGTCEGPPGQRMDNFYGAYFRDLDGNKLCVFYTGA